MGKKFFLIIPLVILLVFPEMPVNGIQGGEIKGMGPEPIITWSPEKIEIDIFPGTIKIADATFVSKKDLNNVKFWIIPLLPPAKKFISIEPQFFGKVTAGEENSVDIVISVPSGTRLGKYRAMVFVMSEYTLRPSLKFSKPHLRPLSITINIVAPSVEEIPKEISLPSDDRIYEDPELGTIFVKDEIILGFTEGAIEETMKEVISGINGVFLGSDEELNLYQIQVQTTDPSELNQLIEQLKTEENVEVVFHHWIASIEKIPNDPNFNSDTWDEEFPADKNWPQELIKLPSGWDIETGTTTIKVAAIDNGFDLRHEDLIDNIFLAGGAKFMRDHGTHIAGIIGARGNNNLGVTGTMWETSLLLYSAGLENERYVDLAAAVQYMNVAIENNTQIINFSAGQYYEKPEDLKEANNFWKYYVIDKAQDKGKDILFVFAAGNDSKDHIKHSPSSLSLEYDNVISVAAVNIEGELANYSNFGEITVAAPGGDGLPLDEGDVYNTLPGNTYGYKTGTSMATPFVSGLAGLIWSEAKEKEIDLTAAQVKDYIIKGARLGGKQVPGHNFYIINAYQSLKLVVPQGLANTPWPMFQHDVRHTGQSEYVGAQTANLKWRYKTGGSISSSPAIGYDGTVYIGSTDKNLYAFNPDGTLKWKYLTGGYIFSSPAIGSSGTIYVGSQDSYLYAINPDGTLKWRYKTGGYWVNSSPVIGPGEKIYVGADDGYLYAINLNGGLEWKYKTRGFIYASPAIDSNGVIYIGATDGYLYAIDLDGNLKWKYKTGFSSSPSIGSDGTIYVGSGDYYLYAINPIGSLKWKYKTDKQVWSTPAISSFDGTIYIGSSDYYLYAINPDGTLKWKFKAGDNIESSPAIGLDGTIYVGSDDTYIYAISFDGTLKWKYATRSNISHSSPAINSDGTVYIGSLDYSIYAFGE